MEKERFFGHQSGLGWPPAPPEMNWDHSVDGSAQFESALSSMVSSPTSSDPAAAPPDGLAIRELIGRLGTICGGGDGSAGASCYATPLSSPPKLNLSMLGDHHLRYQQQLHLAPVAADPGFAERAARLSCFSSVGRYGGGILEPGKLSRAPSSRSMKASASQEQLDADGEQGLANAREESSVSDPNSGSDSNGRKRKAARKGKAKDATSSVDTKMEEEEDSSLKRSRSAETGNAASNAAEPKVEQNGGGRKHGKESDAKPPETPKQDYIHVRARRGQATDQHSLAERVRSGSHFTQSSVVFR